jgi:hypothetical protein
MTARALPGLALCALAASCGPPPPVSPERAAEICAERARAAAGPTGAVRVGANSRTGLETGVAVGLSGDFLRGRDPQEVYRTCVMDLVGGTPAVRPEFGR